MTSTPLVAQRMGMAAFPPHLMAEAREPNDHAPGFAVTGWLARYPLERWGDAWVGHRFDGSSCAIEWVMQPMNVRGVSIGTLRDGKISANRDCWNGAAQLVPNT